jgi:hypothetical protein
MSRAPSAGRRHYDCRLRTSSPGERRPSPAFRLRRGEGTLPRSRGALRPGFAWPHPKKGGCRECRVRSAPAASCANSAKNAHEKNRYRRSNPAFCAMVLRLMPRSPRRRIRLVTVAHRLRFCRPGRANKISAGLAPATGVGTTWFCRTLSRRSSCAPWHRSRAIPPCDPDDAPTLSRPPHPVARS